MFARIDKQSAKFINDSKIYGHCKTKIETILGGKYSY